MPIRVLFSEYVSDYWIGSLGVVTIYALVIWYLAEKNKLGRIGHIFERQLKKVLSGKIGKYFAVFTFLFLVYFGSSLILIERGQTIYSEDTAIFYSKLLDAKDPSSIQVDPSQIKGPQVPSVGVIENTKQTGNDIAETTSSSPSGTHHIKNFAYTTFQIVGVLDYSFSVSYAIMDRVMDGWLTHIYVILFVENVEVAGLMIIYRQDPNVIASCIAKIKRISKLQ